MTTAVVALADDDATDAVGQTIVGTDAAENLTGGTGDDILIGGGADDTLTGGGGSNIFRYEGPWYNERTDFITDFVAGIDKLDVGALFPNNTHGSSDPFNDYIQIDVVGGSTIVNGNFKGDNKPNFQRPLLSLDGVVSLTANDFMFA